MARSYLRFPHLAGDTLVFTAEDDVWTAPLQPGARAHRLTADGVPVAAPRFSPDGTLVAWTSWKDGAPEVRVADAEGGVARRLTYWGDLRTRACGWTPKGEVLAVSATGEASLRHTWAYTIAADGGAPQRLPYGPVSAVVRQDDGPGVLLGRTMSRDMAWWKRYRGGTAGTLWWDPDGDGDFTRILPDLPGQIDAPMIVGERIAFLADHEDWGNLYSIPLAGPFTLAELDPDGGGLGRLGADGAGLRRHTAHGAEGAPAFYARHATTDGTRVVYESAGRLYLLEDLEPGTSPVPLDIRLGGPRTARQPYRIDAGEWLGTVSPDRTGRTSVVGVRGTVHRLTHRDGPARTLLAEPGVRARIAQPLGEDRAIWVDDATGEDAICVAPLDRHAGAGELVRYGSGEFGRVLELAAAPDGTTAAIATHDGRLLVLDVASGELREVARGAAGEIAGVGYSPDSTWLAYEDPVEAGLTRIMMVRLRAPGEPDGVDTLVAVTEPRFVDTDPVFTSDGRYLAFLSRRSFDPIYDEHSFDLTFPASWRPFLVPLAARTPSPFGASPDGRPVTAADEEPGDVPAPDGEPAEHAGEDEKPGGDKSEGRKDGEAPPRTVVDVEGLTGRVVPIPVPEARYRGLQAGKDCLLWLRAPVAGVLGDGALGEGGNGADRRPVLERYDLKRRKPDVIADPVSAFAVSGDGSRLVVRDGDTLRVLRTDRSGSSTPDKNDPDEYTVDTGRIVVTVDPAAEWRQMFDEAGRLMRDHFWVPDMAGVDWAGELARYRPLVDAVGSTDDLVDLLWEVQGELGSSHAYVSGPGADVDWSGRPGFLGADLARDEDGSWRVARVLPPETSAPRARSPLADPGVDVRAGDVLLEVAGRPVDPERGPAPLLLGTAGRLTELTVRCGSSGEVRRVVVRPLGGELALRYQDWVAGRRAFVADRSEGRLGYLHVPDMMAPGWAQLHRDFAREARREGLVLDLRGNSGGHTSQLVIEKLARRVIGWDLARHRHPTTYPADAPRGPLVAVVDEHAGSDGDIVTAAFKRLELGPVVGVRTWGGVIGIDSRYGLVDGTRVTQPRYAFWFDHLGWEVENHGVDPDVEVVVRPQDWAAGRDPQLETAVDLALRSLAERPAAAPPDPATRPSRAKQPLPPRR